MLHRVRAIHRAGTTAGAVIALLCAGCSHPVLGRPVLMGASVTAGAGAAVVPGEQFGSPASVAATGGCATIPQGALSVDAAVAYDAVVLAPHQHATNLADAGTYIDAMASLHEQAQTAASMNPTVVIAVDWLFWAVHQALPASMPEADRAAQRLANVDAALKELDQFHCPVVVGDVPQMTRATGGLLREDHEPGAQVRTEANAHLAAWAAAGRNRFILPVSHLAAAVNAGEPLELAGFKFATGESSRLLQRDGLHVTPEGLALLVAASIEMLEKAGVVEPGTREADPLLIATRLEAEARAAKGRAQPGLLDTLSITSMASRFRDQLAADDDAAAARTLDSLLDRLESFDTNPGGEGDYTIGLGMALTGLDLTLSDLPKVTAAFTTHWRQLWQDAMADRPHPWRFELFLDYAHQPRVDPNHETDAALIARRTNCGPWPAPHGGLVWQWAEHAEPGTLALCFPELDEAYQWARNDALKSLKSSRVDLRVIDEARRGYSPDAPTPPGGIGPYTYKLQWAAESFSRYLGSRKAAGLPDINDEFLARARADGFGPALAALDRGALISAAREQVKGHLWDPIGFVCGSEVFAATDAGTGTAPDAAIRVPLPWTRLNSYPTTLGFGWAEGLDGAAAVLGVGDKNTVFTRAEVDGSSGVRLMNVPGEWNVAATCWCELNKYPQANVPAFLPQAPKGWVCAPMPLIVDGAANLAQLASAARAVVVSSEPPAGTPDATPAMPISVRSVGYARRAVVRIPMGWDEQAGAPRWARVELEDRQLTLLGVLEQPPTGRLADASLRLHAVWGSGDDRATGQVVELYGFVPGNAGELASAGHRGTVSGAEVTLWWRPPTEQQAASPRALEQSASETRSSFQTSGGTPSARE